MQSSFANQPNMSRAALQAARGSSFANQTNIRGSKLASQANMSRAALQAARGSGESPIRHYRRFHGYDYSRGASLFITFAVRGRWPVFGWVEGCKVALSPAGQAAVAAIAAENRRPGGAVRCVSSIVMPDHVHLRLVLAPTNNPEPLRLVGQFVSNVKRWARVRAAEAGAVFEWEENYHDHICVSRFINEKVDAYIGYNPLKYTLMHGPDAPLKVREPFFSPRFPDDEWWTAAGNSDLLAPERKIAAVSISRSLRAGDFPAVVERLLAAARGGWVVASTFISPGEIAVRRALDAEKLPCIVAKPDPLKMVYRPHVDETAAFAEGRLVVISRECAPEITRYDAWHGMVEALAAMAAASGGGAGAYIHRKGGLPAPKWEFRGPMGRGRETPPGGLKGHPAQVEPGPALRQHEPPGGLKGHPGEQSLQPGQHPGEQALQPGQHPVEQSRQPGQHPGEQALQPGQHEQGGPSGRPECT